MKVIFFSKYSKFYVDLENAMKVKEDADGFEDNCVWTCCVSFSQLWQECMWAVVNVLKSSPNILHRTKPHHKKLKLFDINKKLA